MAKRFWLNRETFLKIAEASGLDIEELYTYVQNVLPGLKKVGELDLTGMEPGMPFISIKGGSL